MKDRTRYFMVPPEEIAYVGFVVHAYEGLAVVRTLDGRLGLIEMLVAPDLEEELDALLRELSRELALREVTWEEIAPLGPFNGSDEGWDAP
jgi:hypothetical protein